jgi:Heparinase II/III-like protein/Heparinase II/III N-terminus
MSTTRAAFGRTILAILIAAGTLSSVPSASQARSANSARAATSTTLAATAVSEPGVDCTPPGSPPLSMARQMRNGILRLSPFPSWRLPRNPTWRENPFRDVNWVFRYQSLRMVLPLMRMWHRTRDPWYLRRAVYLTRDWIADNPRSAPASRAAWGDLATAWRAIVLACVVQAVPSASWARTALAAHGRLLAQSWFYRWHGNHALGQDRGLIAAGCTLGRGDWVRLARSRLARLVVESVDSQGVTNEQAVFYQFYNYGGYASAADRLRRCGYAVPTSIGRIERMPAFLAQATLPDGTYVMLGDTVRRQAARIGGTPAEFAATAGLAGPKPSTMFARYSAGFAFGRTGWGERRAYRDEAMFSLRFGPGRRFHGHADHGSVTLYGNGKRLIDDSGTFTLNLNRWHAFAIGRTAHNVVTVDGVAYGPSSSAPLSWSRSGPRRDDLTIVDRGYSGVTLRRRVVFSRNAGYLVVEDRVSARSSRTFRQLWHLDVGTAPVVGGRSVRSTRASGNVRIIQLAVRPTVRIVKGRYTPVQGWISETLGKRRPAPVVEAIARGRTVRYLTLVVPTRGPNDRVAVTNVRLSGAGWSFDIDVAGVREHVQATAWNSAITSRYGSGGAGVAP